MPSKTHIDIHMPVIRRVPFHFRFIYLVWIDVRHQKKSKNSFRSSETESDGMHHWEKRTHTLHRLSRNVPIKTTHSMQWNVIERDILRCSNEFKSSRKSNTNTMMMTILHGYIYIFHPLRTRAWVREREDQICWIELIQICVEKWMGKNPSRWTNCDDEQCSHEIWLKIKSICCYQLPFPPPHFFPDFEYWIVTHTFIEIMMRIEFFKKKKVADKFSTGNWITTTVPPVPPTFSAIVTILVSTSSQHPTPKQCVVYPIKWPRRLEHRIVTKSMNNESKYLLYVFPHSIADKILWNHWSDPYMLFS